jgi:glutamate-1-semialdehyde aminotransferase
VTSVATNSERVYADASRVVTGGTHSNSRLRAPHPLDFERAEGACALATNPQHYAAFVQACARRNILVAEKALLHSAPSAAHTNDDVAELLAAAAEAFAGIASLR